MAMNHGDARAIAQGIANRNREATKRRDELLRAAYDLLKRNSLRRFIKEACAERVRYDECDSDGYCLLSDIANELDLPEGEDTAPIPLEEAHDGVR